MPPERAPSAICGQYSRTCHISESRPSVLRYVLKMNHATLEFADHLPTPPPFHQPMGPTYTVQLDGWTARAPLIQTEAAAGVDWPG
ncbi:hypothetical protein ACLOJK_020272 [Asimina triloba]